MRHGVSSDEGSPTPTRVLGAVAYMAVILALPFLPDSWALIVLLTGPPLLAGILLPLLWAVAIPLVGLVVLIAAIFTPLAYESVLLADPLGAVGLAVMAAIQLAMVTVGAVVRHARQRSAHRGS